MIKESQRLGLLLQYFSTNFAKSLEKSFIIYYNVGVFLRKININEFFASKKFKKG